MSSIYIGTAYHQVYEVPLSLKDPIKKFGQKKKCPVVSLALSSQLLQNRNLIYSDPFQYFQINKDQNQVVYSQKFAPFNKQPQKKSKNEVDQKIIQFEFFNNRAFYYTNHGNIYSKDKNEQYWSNVFNNQIYQKAVRSLPPQRAGKLLPQYTRCLSTFRDNLIEQKYLAFVGRGVLPFICSTQNVVIWQAKNVSNDFLDLQIPQNDIDLCFFNKGYHLVTAHAQNKIRIYDINSRRRKPTLDVELTQVIKAQKSNLTKMQKSPCEKYLYVGNQRGSIYELDVRKNMAISHKIKDITTSIRDIKISGEIMSVISLDGYLRLYNTSTKQKVLQRYLNTHPTVIMSAKQGLQLGEQSLYKIQQINLDENQNNEQQQEEKKVKKVKKIRKRNKVGLKYLQGNNFQTNVKFQQKNQKQQQQYNNKIEQQDQDLSL